MLREYLTNIANTIRSKLGTSDKVNAQDFADKISEVYDKGYDSGLEDSLISSKSNDWSYAFYDGMRVDLLEGLSPEATKHATKTKFMFAHTSGSEVSFEFSQAQVEKINTLNFENVEDADRMFKSFRHNCSETFHLVLNMPKIKNAYFMFSSFDDLHLGSLTLNFGTDLENVSGMFDSLRFFTKIPNFNTSKCTAFSCMFRDSWVYYPPLYDTSNGTNFNQMFSGSNCYCTTIPAYDTSNGTNFSQMYYNNRKVTTINLIDVTSATTMSNMFYNNTSLTNINEIRGTFKGCDFNFASSTKLTLDTLKRIFIALEDYKGTDYEFDYKLTLSSNSRTLLTNEGATSPNGNSWVEYASDKGWNVA